MDIKSTFDEGLKVSVGDSKESFYHSRELLHHCEQNVDRNVNVKVASGENSNEERVTGHWRQSDHCYKVTGDVAELCSAFGWKVELVNSEYEYLAEVSKQNMEDVAWFLAAYGKNARGE